MQICLHEYANMLLMFEANYHVCMHVLSSEVTGTLSEKHACPNVPYVQMGMFEG